MTKIHSLYQIKNVGFSYDTLPVLSNITFDVLKGEQIALLGANGSGKSTLLQLLAGLLFPTQGEIKVFGNMLTPDFFSVRQREHQFRRRVGFVFQDSEVQLFNPTVWDEVMYGPLHMGMTVQVASSRTKEAIDILSIGHLIDRAPFSLSGGEKKKVALASILSIQPEVWLLDEPTASLDPRSQSRLIDFLDERHHQGCTIITTTHDVVLLEEMADRVIIMSEDHRIVADDSPTNILCNTKLLRDNNLIHEHLHRHANQKHSHPHVHGREHNHTKR